MNRRYFWLIPEFTKFRTVFENEETVLGVNSDNKHRLFRKDTGEICFDEHEALRRSIVKVAEIDDKDLFVELPETIYV